MPRLILSCVVSVPFSLRTRRYKFSNISMEIAGWPHLQLVATNAAPLQQDATRLFRQNLQFVLLLMSSLTFFVFFKLYPRPEGLRWGRSVLINIAVSVHFRFVWFPELVRLFQFLYMRQMKVILHFANNSLTY